MGGESKDIFGGRGLSEVLKQGIKGLLGHKFEGATNNAGAVFELDNEQGQKIGGTIPYEHSKSGETFNVQVDIRYENGDLPLTQIGNDLFEGLNEKLGSHKSISAHDVSYVANEIIESRMNEWNANGNIMGITAAASRDSTAGTDYNGPDPAPSWHDYALK